MTENKDKINVAPRFPKGKKRKKEEIEILAKARLKKRRPKLTKKRVFIPAIAAVLLIMLGFYAAIMSTHYQSTDDAFVEGRIISVAPRVAGPVVNLLVDDNQPVKKGDLLLEIDPNDYQVKLDQAEAKLAEAKARLNVSNHDVSNTMLFCMNMIPSVPLDGGILLKKIINAIMICTKLELFLNKITIEVLKIWMYQKQITSLQAIEQKQ